MLRPLFTLTVALTLLTGVAYPAFITAVGKAAFPREASGQIATRNGRAIGSRLIGQSFTSPAYFWSRPSATSPNAYNAASSSGSNLGPTNPALSEAIAKRIAALHQVDPDNQDPIPVDLVTASASGLDPHISPAAALYQVARVAKARGMPAAQVKRLVASHTEARSFGVLGEPCVNVLALNLALDDLKPR